MWELLTTGYANLMTLGIRKLVDKHPETDSVWNVIAQVERRPELLTREKFVCYDGLPYDHQAARRNYFNSKGVSGIGQVTWVPTKGPNGWGMSEMLHEAFDALCGHPKKRKRLDVVDARLLGELKVHLAHPAIEKVCTMADRRVAHAERLSQEADAAPVATYEDIDVALRQVVLVANFLSSHFFYDAAFGTVVPTPQFDVLHGLDEPWVTSENVPLLRKHWDEVEETMNQWAYVSDLGVKTGGDKS